MDSTIKQDKTRMELIGYDCLQTKMMLQEHPFKKKYTQIPKSNETLFKVSMYLIKNLGDLINNSKKRVLNFNNLLIKDFIVDLYLDKLTIDDNHCTFLINNNIDLNKYHPNKISKIKYKNSYLNEIDLLTHEKIYSELEIIANNKNNLIKHINKDQKNKSN